jgi:hypothetical protein
MATTIEDGSGKGYSVKVDETNRLSVRGTTESEFDKATRSGNAYNVNTLFYSITGATEQPIIYVKNNEDEVITLAAWFIGTSGSTSSNGILKMYTNPTTGTIISAGDDVESVNRLIGSSNQLQVDVKKGGDGFTVSGYNSTPVLYQPQGANARTFGSIQLALTKGSSVVVNYDPNGQQPFQIYIGFQIYISEAQSI